MQSNIQYSILLQFLGIPQRKMSNNIHLLANIYKFTCHTDNINFNKEINMTFLQLFLPPTQTVLIFLIQISSTFFFIIKHNLLQIADFVYFEFIGCLY